VQQTCNTYMCYQVQRSCLLRRLYGCNLQLKCQGAINKCSIFYETKVKIFVLLQHIHSVIIFADIMFNCSKGASVWRFRDWNAASHSSRRIPCARQVSKALPSGPTTCRDALQFITHHEPISTLSFLTKEVRNQKRLRRDSHHRGEKVRCIYD
jgi:hypothetical protein